MRRFVIFLIRKKLGVKKYERFRFATQKENSTYYFTEVGIMKENSGRTFMSGVSINWLLDDACKIVVEGGVEHGDNVEGLSD